MKFFALNIVFVFIVNIVYAQNLVLNSSFEDTISCPITLGQISLSQNWVNPNDNTPDFFHECNSSSWPNLPDIPGNFWGYQLAHFGNAFGGGGANYSANGREYLTGELIDTLIKDKIYKVSFYFSLADSVKFTTDRLGAYLHDTLIYQNNLLYLPFQPQVENTLGNFITDKTTWNLIEGFYPAHGGEKYITIGNFYPDSLTDTIGLNNLPISPKNKNATYFYIDDVYVGEYVKPIFEENKLDLFPSPAIETINFNYELKEEEAVLKIYNIIGQLVREEKLLGNNGIFTLDLFNFSQGMYFATLMQNDIKLLVKKFNVIK
jgi:hypothetical protein